MRVTDKGQVTIPKEIRDAAGVLPGSEVQFSFERGRIVLNKVADARGGDKRAKFKAAAARVRASMAPQFRQMPADDILRFLRADDVATEESDAARP
jgi:AbrB family looped-hinge helix DNA binding protein